MKCKAKIKNSPFTIISKRIKYLGMSLPKKVQYMQCGTGMRINIWINWT
jgi:hypothetical protein